MKKLLYFAAAAMIAAIAGCTEDIIAPDNQEGSGQETVPTGNDSGLMPHKTIKVSSADTKTSLSGLQILWDKGDQISLFNKDGQTCTYTLVGEGGQTYGDFETETEPETGYKYAIYPAVEGQAEGSSVAVEIPAVQTYDGENFPAPYPMAAVSSDGEKYSFVNLATVLDLSLVGDAAVKTISIEAAGGEKLAGAATVDFNGETPVMTATESASVTLTCTEPVQLTASATEFRFIVAPGTYSKGFKITVTDNEGKTTVITTAEAESVLTAGTIKNFGGQMGVYANEFENIYILGDGTFYTPWSLDEMIGNPAFNSEKPEESEWSSAFTHAGNGIYTWTGVLAPGTFKFPWKNSFNDFFGYQDGHLVYHPDGAAPDDPKYTVGTAGNYTITIDIHKLTFDIKTNSTYSVPEELYLIGDVTPGGWDLSKAIKMGNQGNGIFYVEAELSDPGNAEGFKFVFNRETWDGIQFAWALNRIWQGGTDRKNDMVGNEGYGDGLYSIKVDTVNWTYELKKIS